MIDRLLLAFIVLIALACLAVAGLHAFGIIN